MIPYKRWENFSLINNDVITTSILLGCKFIDVCRKNKNVFLILIEINMILLTLMKILLNFPVMILRVIFFILKKMMKKIIMKEKIEV